MGITVGQYEAIVIGASAGGLNALTEILGTLPPLYGLPILLVQHRAKDSQELFEQVLQSKCKIRIKQAEEKEMISPGYVYVAPPDYHMLVEMDRTVSFSLEPPVQFSRPSIDVLFESAAMVFGNKLIGIIMTGSNNDGAAGLSRIASSGGLTIAQDPRGSQFSYMPQAAIDTNNVKYIWDLPAIGRFLRGKNA